MFLTRLGETRMPKIVCYIWPMGITSKNVAITRFLDNFKTNLLQNISKRLLLPIKRASVEIIPITIYWPQDGESGCKSSSTKIMVLEMALRLKVWLNSSQRSQRMGLRMSVVFFNTFPHSSPLHHLIFPFLSVEYGLISVLNRIINVSQGSDGAAAVLLAQRSVAKCLGLPILGKFVSASTVGVPPRIMVVGPAYAIPRVL